MEYKGYLAHVEFDEQADLFHGEVINIRDVITFQGRSVEELRQAFEGSVEDYLAFCAERGEEPEPPFSGRITLHLPQSATVASSWLRRDRARTLQAGRRKSSMKR
jgi:predicted HicB family RNase H-like nuclease